MPVEKLLSQLRGLPPPLEPGWWPLAPGWWMVLGIIGLLLFTTVYFRRQKYNQRLYQQAKLELLRISNSNIKTEDSQLLLLSLSSWLKRVCIIAFPDMPVAAMTGQQWIEFLDQTLPGHNFTQGIGQVFASEIYSKQPVVDSDAMLILCNAWLLSIQPDLISAMRPQQSSVSSC